jgi:hypothetical protein
MKFVKQYLNFSINLFIMSSFLNRIGLCCIHYFLSLVVKNVRSIALCNIREPAPYFLRG